MEDAAKLSIEVNDAIAKALATKDPKGEAAFSACELHKKWLCVYWPDGYYRPEAHKGLAEMYCQDARFREYYEKIGPNCADFLKEAINHYCDQPIVWERVERFKKKPRSGCIHQPVSGRSPGYFGTAA
jgi:hypothetical protein